MDTQTLKIIDSAPMSRKQAMRKQSLKWRPILDELEKLPKGKGIVLPLLTIQEQISLRAHIRYHLYSRASILKANPSETAVFLVD